jgi:hypothetical protein
LWLLGLFVFQEMAESSRKRSRKEMVKVLKEKFKKRTLVVERGVKVADLEDPAFSFILDIFRDRGWLSLFRPVNAYVKLVREFYTNIDKISMTPPSFITTVLGAKIHVTAELFSKGTRIPLEPNHGYPFPSSNHPNMTTMQTMFAPQTGLFWLEHEKFVPLGRFSPAMRLLARIVLQNVWPINRHSEIGFERARFMFGIVDGIPICLCTHAVAQMIEAYRDKSTSLPYAGLITKLLKHLELPIPNSEPVQVPQGYFGKATVQKSEAQLHQAAREMAHEATAPAVGGDLGASSSSSVSMEALMEQVIALVQMMGSVNKRVIAMDERQMAMEKRQVEMEQQLVAVGVQLSTMRTNLAEQSIEVQQIDANVKSILDK